MECELLVITSDHYIDLVRNEFQNFTKSVRSELAVGPQLVYGLDEATANFTSCVWQQLAVSST